MISKDLPDFYINEDTDIITENQTKFLLQNLAHYNRRSIPRFYKEDLLTSQPIQSIHDYNSTNRFEKGYPNNGL